jgi:hypothetical protein
MTASIAPATAPAEDPAIDEYTRGVPTAGGKAPGAGETPGTLPPAVAAELEKAPDGAALKQVSTDPALGAPAAGSTSRDSDASEGSGAGGVLRALGEPGSMALLAVMLVGLTFVLLARRRSGGTPA